MSWNSGHWSGGYWGAAGRRQRKSQPVENKKDKEKKAGEKQASFPAYDAVVLQQSEPPSSSAGSSDAVWQTAFKSLLASNPGLSVPQEVTSMLGGEMKKEMPRASSTRSKSCSTNGARPRSAWRDYKMRSHAKHYR